jgi:ribosome-binding factor A
MREVSMILETEVKDRGIEFVTITAVKTTSDLSFCKIYVTVLNDDKKDEIMKSLKGASGFIRTELANRIEVRHIPKLEFVYDESIEYGNKIESIIEKIHEKEEK